MKTKILSLAALLLSIFATALPPYVPSYGLQGYWPFSGNANDISAFGRNGTVFGATLVNGQPNGGSLPNDAYSFNGSSDYISTAWNGVLGTSARAVSFWAAVDLSAPTAMEAVGWGNNSSSSSSQGKRFSICFNKPSGSFIPSSSLAFCIMGYNPSPVITNLVWHHYVYQIPSGATIGQMQIYEDGVLLTSPSTSQNWNTSTAVNTTVGNTVLFGKLIQGTTSQGFFKGYLDDIGIWNRTLNMCEITNLYQCTLTCTDTIHVDPPNSCCLGNSCTDSQNALTADYEIPLNGLNFNFSGDTYDKVNIGYNCGSTGNGKLNAFTSAQTSQIAGQESISVYGRNLFNATGSGIGVMGEATNQAQNGTSIGVWGNSAGTSDNIGGKFYAGNKQLTPNKYNIGVSTVAKPSTGNSPAYTYLSAYPNGANIGIYAAGELNNSTPDGSIQNQDWAGWFDGDVNVVGNAYQNQVLLSSDQRFKKDIKALENVSEKIKKLSGYTYSFKADEFKYKGFDKNSHIGFIAQELKEVFPELVTTDAKGYYAVDYQGMIPVLLQVTKEQQSQIEKQQQQINELSQLVQSLAGNPNKTGSTASIPVSLSDKNTIILNQNIPNPFAESTVISYNIPSDFTKAQIIFTTNDGTVIKTVNITEKGAASLSVFANDLSHGIYSYSLIVDGKTIDTKKMIKE